MARPTTCDDGGGKPHRLCDPPSDPFGAKPRANLRDTLRRQVQPQRCAMFPSVDWPYFLQDSACQLRPFSRAAQTQDPQRCWPSTSGMRNATRPSRAFGLNANCLTHITVPLLIPHDLRPLMVQGVGDGRNVPDHKLGILACQWQQFSGLQTQVLQYLDRSRTEDQSMCSEPRHVRTLSKRSPCSSCRSIFIRIGVQVRQMGFPNASTITRLSSPRSGSAHSHPPATNGL